MTHNSWLVPHRFELYYILRINFIWSYCCNKYLEDINQSMEQLYWKEIWNLIYTYCIHFNTVNIILCWVWVGHLRFYNIFNLFGWYTCWFWVYCCHGYRGIPRDMNVEETKRSLHHCCWGCKFVKSLCKSVWSIIKNPTAISIIWFRYAPPWHLPKDTSSHSTDVPTALSSWFHCLQIIH